jgi:large subunit ribosomal protein L18
MATMTRAERRDRRHRRVRLKVAGSAARPRLSVFRSNRGVFAQLVDDDAGRTLASADWLAVRKAGFTGTKSEQAAAVGRLLAERAVAAGIEEAVFDRSGYLFHGRVKALADAAREGGLRF